MTIEKYDFFKKKIGQIDLYRLSVNLFDAQVDLSKVMCRPMTVLYMWRTEDSTHEIEVTDFNTAAYMSTYKLHVSTYNQEIFSIGRPVVLCVDLQPGLFSIGRPIVLCVDLYCYFSQKLISHACLVHETFPTLFPNTFIFPNAKMHIEIERIPSNIYLH